MKRLIALGAAVVLTWFTFAPEAAFADSRAEVMNYGMCVRNTPNHPSDGVVGPMILMLNGAHSFEVTPQADNPSEHDRFDELGCAAWVTPGSDR